MRNLPSILALSTTLLLAACGGGDEGAIVDEKPTQPTGMSASLTVAGAGDPGMNGVYSSTNVSLNNVTKVNPIGGDPETCRFKFSGLQQQGGPRMMDGDIRYIPGTNELRTTFVSINAVEFRLQGTAGATVDRTNGRVVYTNAVLSSTAATGHTITLSGTMPMLGNRPEGC